MAKYAFLTLGLILCVAAVAVAQPNATLDTVYQVRYAKNLNLGDATITIVNDGVHGAALPPPNTFGAICANLYGFAATTGQEISCCSCQLSPNTLAALSVWRDVLQDSPASPANTVVLKLVATIPAAGPPACNAAVISAVTPPGGLLAWGTTPQPSGFFNSPPAITETPFLPATLSAGELASMTIQCTNLHGGVPHTCPSCPLPPG